MAVKGISNAALFKKAVEGDQAQVPIGQTIITNTPQNNSANVRLENEGASIENLSLSQFDSYGHETLSVGRDDTSNIVSYSSDTATNGRIAELSFNKDKGCINLVKQDGSILTIDGFLTQNDYGVGPTGPRGDRGKDMPDGWDGEDGKEGCEGCKGLKGSAGEEGMFASDGVDGPQGEAGVDGCEGTQGAQGPVGPAGRKGDEGSRGYRGEQCSEDGKGSVGAQGPELNTSAVISSEAPDNLSVLWAVPS